MDMKPVSDGASLGKLHVVVSLSKIITVKNGEHSFIDYNHGTLQHRRDGSNEVLDEGTLTLTYC